MCTLDGLSRNAWDVINLIKLIDENGVEFHSIAEGIDTGGAIGKYLLRFVNVLHAILHRTELFEINGLKTDRAEVEKIVAELHDMGHSPSTYAGSLNGRVTSQEARHGRQER